MEEVLKMCLAGGRIGGDAHCTVTNMWTMEGMLAVVMFLGSGRGIYLLILYQF